MAVVQLAAPALTLPAPCAIADILIDTALAQQADCMWIEPRGAGRYLISIERAGSVIGTTTLDAAVGSAVIARLAFVANVDLTSARAVTGTVTVRGREHERELVFTLRPGAELRAEAMLVARGGGSTIATSVPRELVAGDRVDHYRVLAPFGAGGMGSVYRVEHATLGRQYALKVLHAHVLERDAASVDQFLREARAAARIRHPHIVDVFDFGYLGDGRPYFVMELLDGVSLGDLIDDGALPPQQAVTIARQLAEALAAAHEAGVIHADVSASNVLVHGQNETVKLVDFGLAELRGGTKAQSDMIHGTPCYIAPELIRGQLADEKSDQYSFGVLLFEMLSGRPPFDHDDVRTLCLMHLRDAAPCVTSPHCALPLELQKLVERCLSKSPKLRFPSMRALIAELSEIARVAGRSGWRRWLAP
jgi:serine/threonine protein kinase